MLEARGLTKRFHSLTVVDHVNFAVRAGEICGLPRTQLGSGKSTTVKMMTGLLHPTEGEILFNGRNIRTDNIEFKKASPGLRSRRTPTSMATSPASNTCSLPAALRGLTLRSRDEAKPTNFSTSLSAE